MIVQEDKARMLADPPEILDPELGLQLWGGEGLE
jgi:hypothetical protein